MKPLYVAIGMASALLVLGGCSSMSSTADTTSTTSTAMASSGSTETIRAAQQSLTARGYNVGSVDGKRGAMTQSAILKFQQHRGLNETGQLDPPTLAALGVSS